jgi:hypothetical protein
MVEWKEEVVNHDGHYLVSTVQLLYPMSTEGGFETRVFVMEAENRPDWGSNVLSALYSSEDEARDGHRRILALFRGDK